MPQPNQPPTVSELAEWHLFGLLKDEQVDALNDLLLRDAEARKHCALAFETMSMVHEEFRRREENAEMHAGEPLLKDFDEVFTDLLQMEQDAEVVLHSEPSVLAKEPARHRASEADSLSFRDYIEVGGYAARKALLSKPMVHTGIGAVVAAILLLGLFLFNPFVSDAPALIAKDSGTSPQPSVNVAVPTNTVATLTAQHNAIWAEGALAPGSELRAGTRLTLTAGIAEITTNDGAIAILEAPAAIELLDNDNAIRLHTGKLVGICETESSKGFLVRTPHMDVTDLGTRFGVDASSQLATEVHVFEGTVAIGLQAAGDPPVRLTAGQSATASRGSLAVKTIAYNPAPFKAIGQQTLELPGTGIGLSAGDRDPNWRVIAVDGQMLDTALPMNCKSYSGNRGALADPPNDPVTGQWITFAYPDSDAGLNTVNYTVQVEVVIPHTVDLTRTRLDAVFKADNALRQMRINGQAMRHPAVVSKSHTLIKLNDATLDSLGMRHGNNTVQFDIENDRSSVTGLHVRWQLVDMTNQDSD